jgi:hypothetical protein
MKSAYDRALGFVDPSVLVTSCHLIPHWDERRERAGFQGCLRGYKPVNINVANKTLPLRSLTFVYHTISCRLIADYDKVAFFSLPVLGDCRLTSGDASAVARKALKSTRVYILADRLECESKDQEDVV